MVGTVYFSPWNRNTRNMPGVRVLRACHRSAVLKCQRGCIRATLSPCIKACLRAVANPAVNAIGLPGLLDYVLKARDKLLKEYETRTDNEQRAMSVLTNNCLTTCIPYWTKKWVSFCGIMFRRICVRMSMTICHQKCRRACRIPCQRTPIRQIYRHKKTKQSISTCLMYCIAACVRACMRACKILVPLWLNWKGKHICRPVLNETAKKLAAKWMAEEVIEEREAMTDKCNVANGCHF